MAHAVNSPKYFGAKSLGTMMPSYSSDSAFETAINRVGQENDRYWNSTDKRIREHNGISWRDIIYQIIDYSQTYNAGSPSTSNWDAALDKFKNQFITSGVSKITFAAGDWLNTGVSREILNFNTDKDAYILLEGDTRDFAGYAFVQGVTPLDNPTNSGSGQITNISASGNVVTVTRAGSNPDFNAAGIVSGDKVNCSISSGVSGSLGEYTVDSVSGNTITFTSPAPFSGGGKIGSFLALQPNRSLGILASSLYLNINCKNAKIMLKGWNLKTRFSLGGNISTSSIVDTPSESNTGCHLYISNCHIGNFSYVRNGLVKFGSPIDSSAFARSYITRSLQAIHGGHIYGRGIGMGTIASSFFAIGPYASFSLQDCYGAGSFRAINCGNGYVQDADMYFSGYGIRTESNGKISTLRYKNQCISGDVAAYGIYSITGGETHNKDVELSWFSNAIYALDGGTNVVTGETLTNNITDFNPSAGAYGNNMALNVDA